MFSVIKSEKKIFESYIESIPDIWFRGKNADKYFLCPVSVSKQQFCNAARNCFHPMTNWQKIKCQILESRFKTYQLAKAAEDSISRNLEVLKKNVNTAKRVCHVGNEHSSLQTVATHLEADDIDKIIERKLEVAIAKHFKDLEVAATDVEESVEYTAVATNKVADVSENIVESIECRIFHDLGSIDVEESVVNIEVGTNGGADISEKIVENLDLATVSASTESATNAGAEKTETTIDDSYLPVKRDQNINKLEQELAHNFEYFHQKYQRKGGEKISTTMKIVGNKIIDDAVLKDYSYLGRGDNKNFSQYKNVCNLIIQSTLDAYNNHNDEKVTKEQVETYFQRDYIRLANQRFTRSLTKK